MGDGNVRDWRARPKPDRDRAEVPAAKRPSAQDFNVMVKAIGDPKLTLAQKLAVFDPALHGGEAIASRPVGQEAL